MAKQRRRPDAGEGVLFPQEGGEGEDARGETKVSQHDGAEDAFFGVSRHVGSVNRGDETREHDGEHGSGVDQRTYFLKVRLREAARRAKPRK